MLLRLPCGALTGDLFVPLIFVLFNVGDITGRLCASIGPWGHSPPRGRTLVVYATSRIVFVAALAVCRVVTPHPWLLPVVFRCCDLTM